MSELFSVVVEYEDGSILYYGTRYVPEKTCFNDSVYRYEGGFFCSKCSINLDIADIDEEDLDVFYEPNYCPNCGARVQRALEAVEQG